MNKFVQFREDQVFKNNESFLILLLIIDFIGCLDEYEVAFNGPESAFYRSKVTAFLPTSVGSSFHWSETIEGVAPWLEVSSLVTDYKKMIMGCPFKDDFCSDA